MSNRVCIRTGLNVVANGKYSWCDLYLIGTDKLMIRTMPLAYAPIKHHEVDVYFDGEVVSEFIDNYYELTFHKSGSLSLNSEFVDELEGSQVPVDTSKLVYAVKTQHNC